MSSCVRSVFPRSSISASTVVANLNSLFVGVPTPLAKSFIHFCLFVLAPQERQTAAAGFVAAAGGASDAFEAGAARAAGLADTASSSLKVRGP